MRSLESSRVAPSPSHPAAMGSDNLGTPWEQDAVIRGQVKDLEYRSWRPVHGLLLVLSWASGLTSLSLGVPQTQFPLLRMQKLSKMKYGSELQHCLNGSDLCFFGGGG